jgi:hypothetical protein
MTQDCGRCGAEVNLEYNGVGQRWESFNADGSPHGSTCAGVKADHENIVATLRQTGVVADQAEHSAS